MRKLFTVLFLILVTNVGCTISHEYGPYSGKVVDRETGTPIEGAVVFIRFSKKKGHFAGASTYCLDAREVLTDNEGEFFIQPVKMKMSKFDGWFDPEGYFIIFKPGYGAYPGHKWSSAEIIPEGSTSFSCAYMKIKLPQLHTLEERYENLLLNIYTGSGVPNKRQIKFNQLRKIERKNLGLTY